MNIIEYTEDHHQFRNRLRAFLAAEVIPNVEKWEKDHTVSKAVWQKMGQQGFLCPTVHQKYGGLGGDFRYSMIVSEEMSRTFCTGLAASLHSDIIVPYLDTFGTEAQKEKYLPGCVKGEIITAIAMTEPNAGSDLAGMETTAVQDGDMVNINGSKTFISNGIINDLLIIAAKDPNIENKHQAISLYLIEADTAGYKKGNKLEKMGWHSQDTAELFFSNCQIPVANQLGDAGAGFLMLMDKLQQERLTCVLGAVFTSERILEWTINHLRTTIQNGKPLIKSQATQFALVEMQTELNLAKTFMEKLVVQHINHENIIVETSMAKYWTTDSANRIADRCLDLVGNFAMLETCPLVRAKRDVRVMSIFAGTNEIMKNIAAKFMGF